MQGFPSKGVSTAPLIGFGVEIRQAKVDMIMVTRGEFL